MFHVTNYCSLVFRNKNTCCLTFTIIMIIIIIIITDESEFQISATNWCKYVPVWLQYVVSRDCILSCYKMMFEREIKNRASQNSLTSIYFNCIL